jgi:hypothetical protein
LIAESLRRGKQGLEPAMPEPDAVERSRDRPDYSPKPKPVAKPARGRKVAQTVRPEEN